MKITLLEQAASWPNLLAAYSAVRKTKRLSRAAAEFHADYSGNLNRIREGLLSGEWSLSPCSKFRVYNYTKQRDIEAPAYADRIVHHAVVQVIEPLFERRFIFDSYSCRRGKGTHAAVRRAQMFLRRSAPCYILQCDISKFFPSIHHDVMRGIIARTITEPEMLSLVTRASFFNTEGRGLPIGALTSQLLSNAYLDILDHFIKDTAGIRQYLRYADDFLIFDKDRHFLREILPMCAEFLRNELKLSLNPKSGIIKHTQGLDFCGYRIWPTHIKPRKRVINSFRKLIRTALRRGNQERADMLADSFIAYMRHAEGWRTSLSVLTDRRHAA